MLDILRDGRTFLGCEMMNTSFTNKLDLAEGGFCERAQVEDEEELLQGALRGGGGGGERFSHRYGKVLTFY